MEAADLATIARDADGNIIGLVLTGEAAPSIHVGPVRGAGTGAGLTAPALDEVERPGDDVP
jgi:hypothetical protein